MLRKLPSNRVLLRLSVLGLLFAISCGGGSCGGGGCGGCGDGTYTFPADDPNRPDAVVQDEVVRMRINQDFLDFLKPQFPALIAQQLGGSGAGTYVDGNNILHIPLPDVNAFDIGIADARLREGEALIFLDDLDSAIDIQFEEPNGVRLTINNIRLGLQVKIKENVLGTTSSCPIFGDLGPRNPGEPKHATELSIEALIEPGVGPQPDYALDIRIDVADVTIDGFDIDVAGSSVYCAESECQDCALEIGGTCFDPGGRCAECRIFCGGVTNATVGLINGLIDLVRPLLNRILTPIVDGILGNSLNNLNGSSAKVETAIDLAALAGIDALRNANPLGIFIAPTPGDFPVLTRGGAELGMEVTVNAGAEGEIADCIGMLEDFVPNKGPVPEPPAVDSRNRPYHLFATFASSFLNQSLYAIHRNGTLCLRLSSEDVRDLTGGAFTLNASLLSILASDLSQLADDTAPVIIELKPRNQGKLDLGTGEITGQDASGQDIYDWLMKTQIEDLGIAFHVFMHDRYVRVFEVTTDIFVGINIVVLPDNKLELALGELRIDDFTETFNEILPNANFADVLPTLLDLALGAVLSQSLTFDVDITNAVSDALGGAPVYLRVNDIYRDGIQADYLSMTMTFTSSAGGNLMLAANTLADLHEDNGLLRWTEEGRESTGKLRLAVDDSNSPFEMEYQVRVDGGLWRAPRLANAQGVLSVTDAKLRLPGTHEIDVRARYRADYQSLDATPVRLSVMVDPNAPRLKTRTVDAGIEVQVRDLLTEDAQDLVLMARYDDSAWQQLPLISVAAGEGIVVIPWADLGDAERLELQATDARDNLSKISSVRLGLDARPAQNTPQSALDDSGCSCHDTEGLPHNHNEWPLALFALALGFLVFRLRRN